MVSAKLRIHSAAESRFEAKNIEKYCVFEGTNHDASIFTCKYGPRLANVGDQAKCKPLWGSLGKIRKIYLKNKVDKLL